MAGASLVEKSSNRTPQPVQTQSLRPGVLLVSAVAAPNISRGGEPIDFVLQLSEPARIGLKIFTLAGERVFQAQAGGITGKNTLSWKVENSVGSAVANGIYLFLLEVENGKTRETSVGKVAVLR